MNPSHDVMDVFSHMILMCAQPFTVVYIKELPVFKVNDYFFKHHQREGELDWVTYMRCMRDIMAEGLGYQLSD